MSRLPGQFSNLVVFEETKKLPKTNRTDEMIKSPLCLVSGIDKKKIMEALVGMKEIKITTKDLLNLIGSSLDEREFCCDGLEAVEAETGYGFNFFMKKENEIENRAVYNRIYRSEHPELDQLCILVKSRNAFCTETEKIRVSGLVFKDITQKKTFFCKKCDLPFTRIDNLTRHENNPSACSTETIIRPISKEYGAQKNIPEELLAAGFIDEEHLNFCQDNFCCFDIETSETICEEDAREKAILSVLSISIASSDEMEATCLIRDGDSVEDGKNLVQLFLVELEARAINFNANHVPAKFSTSLASISEIESKRREEWKRRKDEGIPDAENPLVLFPTAWKQWLRSMTTYRVYGFNSSKFDARVLAPHLFDLILTNVDSDGSSGRGNKKKINVLKRSQTYFNLSFTFPTSQVKVAFCDILSYLPPCSLAEFLKMTGSPFRKGIFPYELYASVDEIRNAKEFPPISAFFSSLKNETCDEKSYNEAKAMFYERINLPEDDSEKWSSMADYLRWYNNLDVVPLVGAIKSWFATYKSTFGIDGYQFASLPSMAQASMFGLFDESSPFLHSLPPWKKELSERMRESVVGGLTTNLHRAVLLDGSDGPEAAKKAPNGNNYSAIIPFDFNSLYPWALLQEMPTGPGIHWDCKDKDGNERSYFVKKNMLPSSSFQEFQYLMYLNHHDLRFKDETGMPIQIENAFYRGQKEIAGYKVDGYCKNKEKIYLIEFNGCAFHRPCPHSGCKFHEGYFEEDRNDYDWYKKEVALRQWCDENNGELIVQWSCQLDFKELRDVETPVFPRILKPFETKSVDHITRLVLNESLFGFVECDLESPDSLIEKYSSLNFPPIIRRSVVSVDMLGEFMQKRLEALNRKLPKNEVETVVNSWHAEKVYLYTPLLKWYLELGLKITKVYDVVQYQRAKCFTKFISTCVQGRIDATAAGQSTAAQTFKIAMNSR